MRRTVLAIATALAVMTGASLAPQEAHAMPVTTGIAAAVGGNNLVQDAAYVCRPIWRCGRFGCGWRRVCYWSGSRRFWGPRRFWGRPHWRGRHWRHRW